MAFTCIQIYTHSSGRMSPVGSCNTHHTQYSIVISVVISVVIMPHIETTPIMPHIETTPNNHVTSCHLKLLFGVISTSHFEIIV